MMWNPFKKSNTSMVPSDKPKTGWRRSMWVHTADGVGILFDMQIDKYIVHLVDAQGLTTASKEYYPQDVRQATRHEIPASRRPTDEVATYLGY